MASFYDCPQCDGKKTMKAEKSTDRHRCEFCGFETAANWLAGYWLGYERKKLNSYDLTASIAFSSMLNPNEF